MYFTLIAELLLGVLAVFGLYLLLRGCLTATLVVVALELTEQTEAHEIPRLLAHARECCMFGYVRMIALLPATQRENQPLLEALRQEGVAIRFIESE